jgi:hypothetical protein
MVISAKGGQSFWGEDSASILKVKEQVMQETEGKQSSDISLPLAGFLYGLLFDPENGRLTFLCNIPEPLGHTALHTIPFIAMPKNIWIL